MPKLFQRPDSPYWWASGWDHEGQRWRESTKTADRAAALRIAKRLERERLLADPQGPVLRLDDALDILRKAKTRAGRAPATMRILAEKGGRLLATLGPARNVAALTLQDAEAYVDRRLAEGVSLHTVQKEWGALRSALRLARRHGYYQNDPADIWPDALRDVYQPRERWLTVDEYRAMLSALPAHRRDHFTVYVHTGMRYQELYRLDGCHVDTVARTIEVDGRKGRRDRAQRAVPLSEDAWGVIRRRMDEHGQERLFPDEWSRSAIARALKAASVRAELPLVSSTNDLRRTFATWLLHASVPEATTIRLMGHSSSQMVRQVYAQHSGELLRDAIDRLPAVGDGRVVQLSLVAAQKGRPT